jgi:hypothetical protein
MAPRRTVRSASSFQIVSGRYSRCSFWVAAAVSFLPFAAHAIGPGPGQSDKSGELLITVLAFPVFTLAAAAAAVLLSRRSSPARIVLWASAGAGAGLILTTLLGIFLMSNSARDAWFFGSAVLTLGAIPAGLIGLIVGGLVTLLQRKPPAA